MAPRGAIFRCLYSSCTKLDEPHPEETSGSSIPRRREAGIDAAPVLRQPGDGFDVLVVQPDMLRVEIGLLALAARRLRNRGDAVLVKQPFQRHLRGGGAVLAADRRQRR